MIVQINRDPFARASLMRETLDKEDRCYGCKWCGLEHARFLYGWENDAGGAASLEGPFCSVGCYRAYGGA